jgi:hypothetical protein
MTRGCSPDVSQLSNLNQVSYPDRSVGSNENALFPTKLARPQARVAILRGIPRVLIMHGLGNSFHGNNHAASRYRMRIPTNKGA